MVVMKFIVEIDIEKKFNASELEHIIGDGLDNTFDFNYLELNVKEFNPDEY